MPEKYAPESKKDDEPTLTFGTHILPAENNMLIELSQKSDLAAFKSINYLMPQY